jgi:hypothetical protein
LEMERCKFLCFFFYVFWSFLFVCKFMMTYFRYGYESLTLNTNFCILDYYHKH